MPKNTSTPTGTPGENTSDKMDNNNSIFKSRVVRAVVKAVRTGVLAGSAASQLLTSIGCGARTGLETDESSYVGDAKKHPTPAVDAGPDTGCMGVDAGPDTGCMGVDAGPSPCMGPDAG